MNTKLKIGTITIVGLLLLAVFAPLFCHYSPAAMDWLAELAKPSRAHLFGLDDFGRDLLARILYGARLSLGVGIVVVLLSSSLGIVIGLVAGFFGGRIDELFVFVSDLFMSFPSILLIIAIAAFMPPSIFNVILILSGVGWVGYARLVRSQVLEIKNREFVLASRTLGAGVIRQMFCHVLPNCIGPIVIAASLGIGGVILAESTLSFLGIGVPPELPSWGGMLGTGVRYLLIAPHLALFPGLFIMTTILGFNFLGDGLRDYLAKR